jgi:hypothetical protein
VVYHCLDNPGIRVVTFCVRQIDAGWIGEWCPQKWQSNPFPTREYAQKAVEQYVTSTWGTQELIIPSDTIVWLMPWQHPFFANDDPEGMQFRMFVFRQSGTNNIKFNDITVAPTHKGWCIFDWTWHSVPYPNREAAQKAAEAYLVQRWGQPLEVASSPPQPTT